MRITVFIFFFLLMTACEKKNPDNEAQAVHNFVVPGWVVVAPGINEKQIADKRGGLAQTYDEFVGGLLDDGMNIADSVWMKPTYGNQNILWADSKLIGQRTINSWMKNKDHFNSTNYEFKKDKLIVKGIGWQYAGYTDKTAGTGLKAYNAYSFVCVNKSKGISVFYWGDGMAISPEKNESVLILLAQLTSSCKE